MPPVPHVTFEQFKSYWEFALEVLGLSGAAITAWYRFDLIKSIYDVARGRASREEQRVASEGIMQAGLPAQRALEHVSNYCEHHGHADMAGRIRGISRGPSPQPDAGGNPQHMV